MTHISSRGTMFGPGEEYYLPFEAELIGELRQRDHVSLSARGFADCH